MLINSPSNKQTCKKRSNRINKGQGKKYQLTKLSKKKNYQAVESKENHQFNWKKQTNQRMTSQIIKKNNLLGIGKRMKMKMKEK